MWIVQRAESVLTVLSFLVCRRMYQCREVASRSFRGKSVNDIRVTVGHHFRLAVFRFIDAHAVGSLLNEFYRLHLPQITMSTSAQHYFEVDKTR